MIDVPAAHDCPATSERMVRVGAITMHVYEAGPLDGPLLILLHGFPESGRAWRKLMEPLASQGFHVIAPDMRGYGASEAPVGIRHYRLATLVNDILMLAASFGAERFTLFGHDWGGIVAWALAAWWPERLDKLIILNAPHPDSMVRSFRRHPRQALRSLYIAFFQIPRLPETMFKLRGYRRLRKVLTGSSRARTFATTELDAYAAEWDRPGRLTAMLNYYRALRLPRPDIGQIRIPTMILWGVRDRFLGSHLADAAANYCDDVRLLRFDDLSHWGHHEEPLLIASEIASFLGHPMR